MDSGSIWVASIALASNKNGTYSIPYKPADVYAALKVSLPKLEGFHIRSANDLGLSFDVSVGLSWRSWGESVQIFVLPSPVGDCMLKIQSKSRMGLIDWGKNQDNVNIILSGLQIELSDAKYLPVEASQQAPQDDPAEKLLKLKALLDNNIITNEDYEAKKEKLLQLL